MSSTSFSNPQPWTFITNHAAVLLCIKDDPNVRVRDIAARVGITERAAQRIVRDLVDEGYITSERVGRRNRYTIQPMQAMRHRLARHRDVGAFLDLLSEGLDVRTLDGT